VVEFAFQKGIALTRARYLEDQEMFPVAQRHGTKFSKCCKFGKLDYFSVRVTVNSEMSKEEVDFIVGTVEKAILSL